MDGVTAHGNMMNSGQGRCVLLVMSPQIPYNSLEVTLQQDRKTAKVAREFF